MTATKKRKSARQLRAAIDSKRFIPNPEWANSEEAVEAVGDALSAFGSIREIEDYFPKRYGKEIPEDGAWIRCNAPPGCVVTVPPFSMWFAFPEVFEKGEIQGIRPTIFRIATPAGDLKLWPHEICRVNDIGDFVGRETEGILIHPLDGRPLFDADRLFYIMSRGIPRAQAQLFLIGEMKGEPFCWFEIAPQYGAAFGLRWPTPEQCPFATPRENWHCENEGEPIPLGKLVRRKTK